MICCAAVFDAINCNYEIDTIDFDDLRFHAIEHTVVYFSMIRLIIYTTTLKMTYWRWPKIITDDLLSFTMISETKDEFEQVDLNKVYADAIKKIDKTITDKSAKLNVEKLQLVHDNYNLLGTV